MPRAWYAYNGGPDTAAGSYDLIPGTPQIFECNGGTTICAIYAFYTFAPAPTNPLAPLSPNIQSYIISSRTVSVNKLPQTSGAPTRTYLYKKS